MTTLASPLETRGIIRVQGPDSQKLLQGQCTADVQSLNPGEWLPGGLCTPKGRLYANFYLLALDSETFWLVMPQSNIEPTLSRLGKYAAFFKTTLTDISQHWHGLALQQASADAVPALPGLMQLKATDDYLIMGVADEQHLLWLNPLSEDAYEAQLQKLESQAEFLPESAWNLWETRYGLAWITPETTETFVPQVLAWDKLGGVSFSKGCYTGQEVVARLHYKGASKKTLRRISGSGQAPEPLLAVTDEAGQSIGQIVRTATDGSTWHGLAVINLKAEGTDSALVDGQPVSLGTWVDTEQNGDKEHNETHGKSGRGHSQ